MKTLHLLRHAKSSRNDADVADVERPLAPRGKRDAAALARRIPAMSLQPQLILCSPALRTRQTYAAIASALPPHAAPGFEPELYMASASSLLSRIRGVPESVTELLVIGHNPGLEDLALLLIRQAPTALRLKLAEKLPTCALLTLELELETWRTLAPDCAILRRFWPMTRNHTRALPTKPRAAAHAPQLTVDQDASFEELAEAALSGVRTHAYERLAGAAAGDVEAIHQLRVALRKLRVLLRAFDDVLDANTAQALRTRARSWFRCLGEVRELDVTDETLLSPLIQVHPQERGLTEQRKQLLAARKQRLLHVQHMLHGPQLHRLTHSLDTIRVRAAAHTPQKPRKRARKQLNKQLKQVIELSAHASEADAAELHALRKELKQLRYRAELFAPLFKRRQVRAYACVMSRLQDVLGELNDIAVAKGVLRAGVRARDDAQNLRARKIINAALTAREAGARSKLARKLRKLVHATPFWC